MAVVLSEFVGGHWREVLLRTRRTKRLRLQLLRNGGPDLSVLVMPWRLAPARTEAALAEEPQPAWRLIWLLAIPLAAGSPPRLCVALVWRSRRRCIMRRRMLLAASGAWALPGRAAAGPGAVDAGGVDLALVLAVDVSRSIDDEEAQLQREGYQNAMRDRRVVAAISGGMLGAIAVAYVEWAGIGYQRVVLPWMRVAGAADAEAWSAQLAATSQESLSWTSISGALRYSGRVLERCPFEATRRVIDVSGDGVNNSGPPPEPIRDQLVADGVTINGLPIVNDRPNFGVSGGAGVEAFYRESVIGGPGAFLIVAEDFTTFGEAVRRKMVQEIAGLPPGGRGYEAG